MINKDFISQIRVKLGDLGFGSQVRETDSYLKLMAGEDVAVSDPILRLRIMTAAQREMLLSISKEGWLFSPIINGKISGDFGGNFSSSNERTSGQLAKIITDVVDAFLTGSILLAHHTYQDVVVLVRAYAALGGEDLLHVADRFTYSFDHPIKRLDGHNQLVIKRDSPVADTLALNGIPPCSDEVIDYLKSTHTKTNLSCHHQISIEKITSRIDQIIIFE
jgi:hypothetical protein